LVRLDSRIAQANLEEAVAVEKQAAADVAQAESGVKLARMKAENLESLHRDRLPIAQSNDRGIDLVSAAAVREARLTLENAEAQRRAADAKRASADAHVRALRNQLQLYTLRAPISGRLGIMQAVPGQSLVMGATVAEMVDLSEIDVLCFVPPSQIEHLAVNQPARLLNGDASPIDGKLVFISAQADAQTGSIPIKVRFANSASSKRANLLVHIEIEASPTKERLMLPETALMEDLEPPQVVLIDEIETKIIEGKEETLGKARRLQATIGIRDRAQHKVELLRLEDPKKKKPIPALIDATFVIEGANGLEDGDEVKVVKPERD
jgi:multidrug efflux pump subunit AcrA (membrane-fusion protein)